MMYDIIFMNRHETALYKKYEAPLMKIFTSSIPYNEKQKKEVALFKKYLLKSRNLSLPKDLEKFLSSFCNGKLFIFCQDIKFQIPDILGLIFEMEHGAKINNNRDTLTTDQKLYLPDFGRRMKWILLAHNSSGFYLFMDCDPGPHGKFGQIFFDDIEGDKKVISESLGSFLKIHELAFEPYL